MAGRQQAQAEAASGSKRDLVVPAVFLIGCCFAHSFVASGSHWAGGRPLPEGNDPGQASIRIDARSASQAVR